MPETNGSLVKDGSIRTSADELFELVKGTSKISVEDAAKRLKMPLATVQALVDFLVEDKIFGIEYKFTTPYIYLYNEDLKQAHGKDKSFTKGLVTKEHFYERAKEKKVAYEHIETLWRKYLKQNMSHLRDEFLKKAKDKKIPAEKTEDLWKKYLSYL